MKDKFTPDAFRSWVEWIRERLPNAGDVPGILGPSWEQMTQGQMPPWNESIHSHFDLFEPTHDPKSCDGVGNACVAHPKDLALRFTAMRYFFELSHFDFETRSYARVDEFESTRKQYAADFGFLVRLLPVDELSDWRIIRWEILNAYAVRDWERALKLYNRAEELQILDSSKLHALRGQFRFLLVAYKQGLSLDSLFWQPRLYSLSDDFSDIEPILLLSSGWAVRKDQEYPILQADDLEAVLKASHDLEIALSRESGLSPVYRSLLAWCQFGLGDYQKAAKNYDIVFSEATGRVPPELKPVVCKGALHSIALCWERANEIRKAMSAYERMANELPNEKGIHRLIAKLHHKSQNPQAAYEALQKESDDDPAAGFDWLRDTILMLGGALKISEEHEPQVEEFLRANPEKSEFAEFFLTRYWPQFNSLHKEARGESHVFPAS